MNLYPVPISFVGIQMWCRKTVALKLAGTMLLKHTSKCESEWRWDTSPVSAEINDSGRYSANCPATSFRMARVKRVILVTLNLRSVMLMAAQLGSAPRVNYMSVQKLKCYINIFSRKKTYAQSILSRKRSPELGSHVTKRLVLDHNNYHSTTSANDDCQLDDSVSILTVQLCNIGVIFNPRVKWQAGHILSVQSNQFVQSKIRHCAVTFLWITMRNSETTNVRPNIYAYWCELSIPEFPVALKQPLQS